MSDEEFFGQSSEASEIKIRIVTKYFRFWAKVISGLVKNRGQKMAYYDLFSGPGRYDDGSDSTPILVLKAALEDPNIADQLVTVFNDVKLEYAETLDENISLIPGIEKLQHQPKIFNLEALAAYNEHILPLGNMPSFTLSTRLGIKM